MPKPERGNFEQPRKSALNFEVYDSGAERLMMERLEADPAVRKWTKKHGVTIQWLDSRHQSRSYRPDFLVEYTDGRLALIEVKGAHMADTEAVKRKGDAARRWCERRGMTYELAIL